MTTYLFELDLSFWFWWANIHCIRLDFFLALVFLLSSPFSSFSITFFFPLALPLLPSYPFQLDSLPFMFFFNFSAFCIPILSYLTSSSHPLLPSLLLFFYCLHTCFCQTHHLSLINLLPFCLSIDSNHSMHPFYPCFTLCLPSLPLFGAFLTIHHWNEPSPP